MTKKRFLLEQDKDKPKKTSLSILSKQENMPLAIEEIVKNVNDQVVQSFIELFGKQWKYRTIKEVEEVTGVTLKYNQLNKFVEGKNFFQQTFFALLLVLAKHNKRIDLTVENNQINLK